MFEVCVPGPGKGRDQVDPDPMEVNGSDFLSFSWDQNCAWSFPLKPMAVKVLLGGPTLWCLSSCPCLMDGPWKWPMTLPHLRLLMGFVAMTTWLCPMVRPCRTAPCQWRHSLCWVTCGSWHSPAPAAPWRLLQRMNLCPVRNPQAEIQIKPFRAIEVNNGVITNLCRIPGL